MTVHGVTPTGVSLARGGVMEVEVRGRTQELPSIVASSDAFAFVVTSQTTQTPSLTKLDVTGEAVGAGVLRASVTSFSASLDIRVAELAAVGISVNVGPARDQLTVMTDIGAGTLQLSSTEGEALLDHSIAIDPSSDPEFSLATDGDLVTLPTTLGDHVLVLTRATGELYPVDVRVVDHLDDIVVDRFEGGPSGTLCVHGELEGERVETRAWQFFGSPSVVIGPTSVGCIAFAGAVAGATITVERAGTTKTLVMP